MLYKDETSDRRLTYYFIHYLFIDEKIKPLEITKLSFILHLACFFTCTLSCDLIGQLLKKSSTSLSAFVISWTSANFCTFQSIVVWWIKRQRQQRFFKIGCIPNTLRPLPTGLHVKICGWGWGEKSGECEHTLSCLFFVVFDFTAGLCRMGESISCTLGRHMLGKIWRLLALLASSPVVPVFSCSLLCLCTSMREKTSQDTTEDCPCSSSAPSRDHGRRKS